MARISFSATRSLVRTVAGGIPMILPISVGSKPLVILQVDRHPQFEFSLSSMDFTRRRSVGSGCGSSVSGSSCTTVTLASFLFMSTSALRAAAYSHAPYGRFRHGFQQRLIHQGLGERLREQRLWPPPHPGRNGSSPAAFVRCISDKQLRSAISPSPSFSETRQTGKVFAAF